MRKNIRDIRSQFLLILIGVSLFLVSRLVNLTNLPIFTDEAIYIRWSQIGANDAAWRFISLTDGKQPLFTWLVMAMLRLVPEPLVAGRLVSVIAGGITTIGLWVLSWVLFKNRKISFITSFIYIISPFAMVYDRMAIYDSLVATCFVINLVLAVSLVKTRRLDLAILLGLGLGVGMLNKTSGFLSLYLLPFTLILFPWSEKWRGREFVKWLGGVALAAIISQFVYSILRLSPYFYIIRQKDVVFVYSFKEWLTHPLSFFAGNFFGLLDWLIGYLGWPIILSGISTILVMRTQIKEKLMLLFYSITPLAALALFGKVLYPRFIFFMVLPLFLLLAYTIDLIINKWGKKLFGVLLVIIMVTPSVWASYLLIIKPLYAPIPLADKSQYMNDWPSGWGVKEAVEFLKEEAKSGKVAIYTEGTFGLLPYALEIYLHDEKNIYIKGIWPLPATLSEEIMQMAGTRKTYLITNQSQTPPDWPLELIAEYQKGLRTDRALRIYRIVRIVSGFAYII